MGLWRGGVAVAVLVDERRMDGLMPFNPWVWSGTYSLRNGLIMMPHYAFDVDAKYKLILASTESGWRWGLILLNAGAEVRSDWIRQSHDGVHGCHV